MGLDRTIFRFDDVSSNSNLDVITDISKFIAERYNFDNFDIIYGVSPLTNSGCGERVFPKLFNALSDYRHFYTVDCANIPKTLLPYNTAGHGLIHMDHRLLDYQAQEMSILVSCSLAASKIFIPPFNKWNDITEAICQENGIELIKFEDGWKSCEHNAFDPSHKLWYLHGYAWTLDKFKEWMSV